MATQNETEGFSYSYDAKRQQEIQNIRKKYEKPEKSSKEEGFELLKKMDKEVVRKATVRALTIGIIGALIMGSGMSLVMTDIGAKLGMGNVMFPGIITGIIGMALVSCAYPVYEWTLKRERKRIAPEILRLSDELLK